MAWFCPRPGVWLPPGRCSHYTPQPLSDPLQATSPHKLEYGRVPKFAAGVLPLYGIEAMATIGGTLMSVGIFFYMNYRFAWRMPQNFLLAAAQGVVYVPGALLAGRVAGRFGRRRTLGAVYVLLTLVAGSAWLLANRQGPGASATVAIALLVYTFVIGLSWPILEGLVASGGPPAGIARRIGLYNIIWPAGGALVIAVEGAILRYWTAGIFVVPGLLHLLSFVLLIAARGRDPKLLSAGPPLAVARPEPDLLHKRKLALWLSRTALPATYTVIYGLMPMMPSLPTIRPLPTTLQTLVASVWLMTRWLAFVLLAASAWWHTRPRALVWAALVMLISFFGMTLRPTQGAWPLADLACMILWQAVLGLAIGMIYSGSLYFGMVLSEGSTEHGGYHEALIGLGWVLGPAAGAVAGRIRPDDVRYGIAAVGTVIALSVAAVLIAARRGDRKPALRAD